MQCEKQRLVECAELNKASLRPAREGREGEPNGRPRLHSTWAESMAGCLPACLVGRVPNARFSRGKHRSSGSRLRKMRYHIGRLFLPPPRLQGWRNLRLGGSYAIRQTKICFRDVTRENPGAEPQRPTPAESEGSFAICKRWVAYLVPLS